MTEPTINLQKNLELWYDFSDREFDNQRAEVKDKSGYGEHCEASGGPSFVRDGPASFDGVNLDGTDDQFSFVGPTDITSAFTVHALVRVEEKNLANPQTVVSLFDGSAIRLQEVSGVLRIGVNDSNGDFNQAFSNIDADTWYSVTGVWDGSDLLRLYLNGEVVDSEQGVADMQTRPGSNAIGVFTETNGRYWGGTISRVAIWRRELSDPEVEYLARATEPTVSRI